MRKIIGKKNKVHYVEETTRFQMVKSHKGWLVIGASMFALGLGLNIPATTAHASQLDGQWAARTVQEIKADFDKSGTSQSYKIQWGDTLSAISAAINVSQDRLAQINSIENKDLIFAGNTIQIDGNGSDATITIKDQDGKADKVYNVDPNKPVVNTEKTNELQSENANGTGSASQTPVAANESAQATNANGNITVNDSSSVAGTSNNGASSGTNGSTSTNVKPSNPTNPNGNNGSDNSNTNPSPNKTELEKLKETLASQNAKLSDSQSKLTAAQSDLDAAKSALTAAQNKDISQFESAVQAQTEKVNGVKTDLDNIKTEIDSNTKNIESLNIVIASLKANIASADTDVVTAQNRLATAQSNSDAKQLAYKQIIATISAQYPSINVETADGLATLETSNPDLKAAFDAAKSDKDDSDFELENAKIAVSDASVAKPNMQDSLTENENKIPALTEQINTDTDKVSPLESKLTTETATLSDLQQQLDNAKNSNVEQLQADVNAKQSVVDNLTKEIESAKADIDKTSKSIADIELKVAREDATNKAELDLKTSKNNAVSEINGLKFLSDKQSFTDKVNAAGSIDAVASAVSDAKTVAKLNTYKESAKTTVSNLTKLSDESKTGYTNRIKSATSTTNVDAIVAEAKAESQLIQDKESAVSEIKALVNLSDKEQASFVDAVTNAASKSAVDTVVSTAKAQGQKNLEAKQLEELRVDVKAKISAMDYLSDAQKQDFASKVDAAVTKTAVSDLLVNANATNGLEKAKSEATTEINNLKYLSTDAKSKLTAKVAAAKAKDEIKPISEAAVKDEAVAKELSEAKDAALKTAKGYTHVSNTIKTTATTAIEAATSKDDVDKLIAHLKVDEDKAISKELADAKVVANTTINNLKYLSTDAKSKLTAKVAAAKAKDEIKPISEAAVKDEAVAKELSEAKDAALKTAKGYTHVSNTIKTTATTAIEAATSKDDVDKLIAHLKVDEDKAISKELADAKVVANTTINNLKYLSTDAKSKLTAKVAAAKAKDEIKPISEAAVKDEAVAKELSEAKDAALKTAKGYTHVSNTIKTTATTAIEAATSKDDVDKLIAHLKVDEDKAITKKLSDAKVRANTTINIMKFLQPGQKDDFVKRANSAKDMAALKAVIDAAQVQDTIESHKGTVTFTFVGPDAKIVKMVTQSIKEGNVYVTYKQLGLTKDQVKFVLGAKVVGGVSGGLTVTIEAQKDKPVMILI
ncbi:FmtB protein (plasmid) [Lactococcus lactis subsp. lactis bv. diacetylactis]|uniref:LysM peptidoglycan-binding domain-containing protein n=1 Tax=Lactococcus lactis TaxID=1358 RepID=UPI000A2FB532|nr:LysM peptidoglycan-binding domain-containing protein [Lactococcus lactis]ARR88266.1 FmtB protein [Lactococcus lactis subsp. lactis bv. diacetylactis]